MSGVIRRVDGRFMIEAHDVASMLGCRLKRLRGAKRFLPQNLETEVCPSEWCDQVSGRSYASFQMTLSGFEALRTILDIPRTEPLVRRIYDAFEAADQTLPVRPGGPELSSYAAPALVPASEPEAKDELVQLVDGVPMVDSRSVAERFEKNHRDVMRAIQNLECSKEFRVRNFAHTPYTHAQNGQTYNMYRMTRDGFTFLVMGFTGKSAAQWKERYIAAFNAMEARLRAPAAAGADFGGFAVPTTRAEALRLALELEEENTGLKTELTVLRPKADALDRISKSRNTLTIRDTAQMLGLNPQARLHRWLMDNGWIVRRGKNFAPRQNALKQGYMALRNEADFNSGRLVRARCLVTGKGLARLAQIFDVDLEQTSKLTQ